MAFGSGHGMHWPRDAVVDCGMERTIENTAWASMMEIQVHMDVVSFPGQYLMEAVHPDAKLRDAAEKG